MLIIIALVVAIMLKKLATDYSVAKYFSKELLTRFTLAQI